MPEDFIHIARAEQDPDIPAPGDASFFCPEKECPGERGMETGFGLAGGGYGPYTYCPKCGKIIDKSQELE